ncbi:accessory Sec system glycosyltransferase Asp1 [Lactobacillus xylocopicola]|uniref:Poly(Glycerol-phosphate) alpha-glucosyltransferase n=1 Tax=Lactobacillus xylocopicola TaxID=2976676 RepID=A0ABM8BGR5_9LACO|nr:accessory Sec system glycosyltransferase Asp1 [Lactobacillus xylocopicola]BDR60288.1 poly(glycerol-phosphate) alpha-glucosyltransferase [Lactobacillus xylocopicola]
MYYFLNNRLDPNSSGIEHAEVKRLKLFKQNGVSAKIVMSEFNRFAHRNLPLYGLTDADYVNMFDFFAGTVNYEYQAMAIEDLSIAEHFQVKQVPVGFEVYDDDRKTMEIVLFADNNIDTIRYYNADNNCTKADFYDTRGFRSLTQIYDTGDGHLSYEQFYRPNGTIYYEISYEQRPNWLSATNLQLVDLEGKLHSLMNSSQAFRIMLDELNQQDGTEKSTFISDRSNITNIPMVYMKTPARKIEHFHSIHYQDYDDPASPLSYNSISNKEQLSRTDLIITPGEQQAADMRARLHTHVPIVAIPVGIIPDEQLQAEHVSMSEREAGKIVIVARLFHEKRLDDAIKAFAQAYQTNRALTLDIYGYGDGSDNYQEEKMLKKLVSDLELERVVNFKGYSQDMDSVYNSAQLLLLTSRYEGASLAIAEAQAHGVPVISYDINYGPADLIADGTSGFLVNNGAVNELANKISEFFADASMRGQMNGAAYENSKRFSGSNIWQSWKKYVIDTE